MSTSFLRAPFFVLALATALMGVHVPMPAHAAATFVIVNQDGPGEGLNDASPVSPIGGNFGTTLGEARLRAVEFTAALLANVLASDVPIRVGVHFDPLEGSPDAGVLGLGGPASAFRDFAGAPRAGTWYPSALADRLAGVDLAPGDLDVVVTFNSDTDGDVFLGTTHFYYGFDAAPLADDVDFVSIALHEMAHGLGFQTFLDVTTGEKLFGYDDAYLLHLEHHGAVPADFASMTDAQRRTATTAGPALHWTGASTVAEGSGLAAGVGTGGHLEMHSPSPAKPRSSLSHFSSTVFPDDVLEPFYVEASTRLELTRAVLDDIGWGAPLQCIDASSP